MMMQAAAQIEDMIVVGDSLRVSCFEVYIVSVQMPVTVKWTDLLII